MLLAASLGCLSSTAAVGEPVATYFGLQPPGLEPRLFAPALVSQPDRHEFGSVLSADGSELYFAIDTEGRSEIWQAVRHGESWGEPKRLLFHAEFSFNDPFLAPDQQRLYFISDRPLETAGEQKDFDIWYAERHHTGWSAPINLGPPVNSAAAEYYISLTAEGDLYFAFNIEPRQGRTFDFDIYVASMSGGQFEAPVRFDAAVNSRGYEADAFVAGDGSYLIFSSSRRGGLGKGDLYVSFRQADGSWSTAKNLGPPINTPGHQLCPFVTADGEYSLFTSDQDIYWVKAAVIGRAPSEENPIGEH